MAVDEERSGRDGPDGGRFVNNNAVHVLLLSRYPYLQYNSQLHVKIAFSHRKTRAG